MNPDRVDIEQDYDNNEVIIRIDTTGTGQAVADALIEHIRGMRADGSRSDWHAQE